MPGVGRDGLMRRRGDALVRLLHHGEDAVVVKAEPAPASVRLTARAASRRVAEYGIERMRFTLGVDLDLEAFRRRFRQDRLIGQSVRRRPWLRPARRPEPFEALVWAITEQLIDSDRAAAIQRLLVRHFGRVSACGTLRHSPSPVRLGERSPAELEACGLSHRRSLAMIRVAREVAAGRADLAAGDGCWPRLRSIPTIGAWTVEKLAYEGQGHLDALPAGDLAYLRLVGRLEGLGRRATEEEVRAFFEPYAPYRALAGESLIRGRHPLLRTAPHIYRRARA
jgi:DNA-3-methyladenine glycosylase II